MILRSLRRPPHPDRPRLPHIAQTLMLAVALGLALAPAGARADDDDHDRARRAVQAGDILPLETVLARLPDELSGRVLEAELEHEDTAWIYEITVLRTDGRLLRLEVDARNADVLRSRGDRGRHGDRRRDHDRERGRDRDRERD